MFQDDAASRCKAPEKTVSNLPDGTVKEKLKALFEADFERQLWDNPEFATQAGFHQYDGELQDLTPWAWETRVKHNMDVRAALEKLDLNDASVSDTDRLYAELLLDAADGETRGIELNCHLAPLNSVGAGGAVHENFFELLEWMVFETEDDLKTYVSRLGAFAEQASQFRDLLARGTGKEGGRQRMPAPQFMVRELRDRIKALVDSDLDILREPLKGKQIDPDLDEKLQMGIDSFKRTLQSIQIFIDDEDCGFYEGRSEPGIHAVPKGDEVYTECLRFHTTTRKNAQEIHELGLQEVARIEGRFQKEVMDAVSFKGTFRQFADSLKADKSHFFDSEDALLDAYKELVGKIEQKLPDYFQQLPKMKLEVVRKTAGPAAYYFAGTPDGQRPGRFYVNVSRLEERPRYEMVALALHEGVPGHHLQGARALENEELPQFLRYVEDRRYEYAPARRPLYTGYLEGWALYCERLGEEMGMYSTPIELFGRLSMEMMRAVRLVVDTGIHTGKMKVDEAVKYMQEKTGMAAAECQKEVHRYVAWPGQACAYKVGELAIVEIRAKAEAALGPKFDIKAFHELVVGCGPLPLDILEKRAEAWVAAQA